MFRLSFSLLLLSAVIVQAGCGRSTPAPVPPAEEPAELPAVEKTPPLPEPEPVAVEEETPAVAEPEPVEEVIEATPEEAAAPAFEPGLSTENMQAIDEGMTYDDVVDRMGFPGLTVSDNGADKIIVQWEDEGGVSFMAKFENDRLVRKISGSPQADDVDDAGSPELTQDIYNDVSEGMTFDEVLDKLNFELTMLSESDDLDIVRWEDEHGSSFTARFERGKLTRKSGLTVSPLPETEENDADDADAPAEEEEPLLADAETEGAFEGEVEDEAPARRMRLQDRPWEEIGRLAENIAETVAGNGVASIAAPAPRVRVVGSSRRQRESDAGDRRPYLRKAELPDYTYSLKRGRYEVRIHNDSPERVAVGMRKDKRGRDITIEANSRKSLYLDRGSYTIHYIYNDDPYTVYNSQAISVGGTFVSDIEIVLFNEQYDVRKLVHGLPGR